MFRPVAFDFSWKVAQVNVQLCSTTPANKTYVSGSFLACPLSDSDSAWNGSVFSFESSADTNPILMMTKCELLVAHLTALPPLVRFSIALAFIFVMPPLSRRLRLPPAPER